MVPSHLWLVVALLVKGVFSEDKDKPKAVERDDSLYLISVKDYTWQKDGVMLANGTDLNLGSLWNDPRGVYCRINSNTEKKDCVHVYVRRCMNCIELDPGTIAGFVVADVIMIGLITMAVYFVSGSETRRPGRASDKQNLIEKDSDYQILGRRDDDQYSHLATRPKRGGY
ncbi:T-cell surface glycoprotein CD3 gamma chain-like [Bufo bufo]|uniref:T-cell surface glycoprotein CD3 gamma chain-like n=1 Tax=Bufo bufo TaxID=8384 RepID=UPI001ABE4686|nr:T-cell surface glycoprotein CD3 gamma chain-like [Bufo bufo]